MDVSKSVGDLLEDKLGIGFLQLALALDQTEEVAAASVLHHHEQMLAGLKDLQETDHVGMLYLF